jgi:hypothetical protein
MMRKFGATLALLALASCAAIDPRVQVREKLIEAGIKPSMADCLAEKLVRKLDHDQLRELARVAKLPRQDVGRMSIYELAGRVRAIQDPRIVEVVTRAGLGCAIAG